MPSVLILTHGAGSNRNAPLLVALERAFGPLQMAVDRIDLPFRERRPHGPPFPGEAAADRAAIRERVMKARAEGAGRVFLGGHSYGGRQSTMAAAESPGLADALLLLSYPLHPPRKAADRRTAHFPNLRTPALFVHGSRDPFGALEEMRQALELIPAPAKLIDCEDAGHDLRTRRGESPDALAAMVASEFAAFIESAC